MARSGPCGDSYGLPYSKRTKEECDMGITILDKQNAANWHRIATALERIAYQLEKKTCTDDLKMRGSKPGDKLETHPGHDYQPTYDH